MPDQTEAAKALLSGEYSRRRGYLSSFMYAWNGLAISGTLAIWAGLPDWSLLANGDVSVFAYQIACAGAMSSVLLGSWRFHVRSIDGQIIRTYPTIYYCERLLLPERLGLIVLTKRFEQDGTRELPQLKASHVSSGCLYWREIPITWFGHRNQDVFDWAAGLSIALFAFVSIVVANHLEVATISLGAPVHLVGWLLLFDLLGVVLILVGRKRWERGKVWWPFPEESGAPPDEEEHSRSESSD